MNIMNGSLKGKLYEGLEERIELASALKEKRATYIVAFLEEPQKSSYEASKMEPML